MRFRLRTLLIVLAIIGGCALPAAQKRPTKPPSPALSKDATVAQQQLLRETPVGTDMEAAGERLESLGFKVKRKSPDDYFARLDNSAGGWVAVSWLVSIRGEGGKLRELKVEVAYTGP